jgi:hypothetical protein
VAVAAHVDPTRQKLLACPRFAFQQDDAIIRRHRVHNVEDLLEKAAGANELQGPRIFILWAQAHKTRPFISSVFHTRARLSGACRASRLSETLHLTRLCNPHSNQYRTDTIRRIERFAAPPMISYNTTLPFLQVQILNMIGFSPKKP